MKNKINYGKSVVVLPSDKFEEGIASISEAEIKTLIAICSDIDLTQKSISEYTGISEDEAEAALSFWRGAGILSSSERKKTSKKESEKTTDKEKTASSSRTVKYEKKEAPRYSGMELSEIIDEASLRPMIDECQRILEFVFKPSDIERLVSMYNYLKLDTYYVITLTAHLASKGKKSLAYLEKTVYELYNDGVDTTEKLEEEFKRREANNTLQGKLRRLFGTGEREWSRREREYIRNWSVEWNYDFDVIEYAYEITVNNTGKLTWNYINRILNNWYDSGLRDIEAIKSATKEYKEKKSSTKDNKGSFDTDEFFEAAMRRSFKAMEKSQNKSEQT